MVNNEIYTTITLKKTILNRLRTTNPCVIGAGKKIELLLEIHDYIVSDSDDKMWDTNTSGYTCRVLTAEETVQYWAKYNDKYKETILRENSIQC